MEAQAYRAYVSLALATIQERSTTLPIWSTITPFDERSLQTQEGETSFRYDNSRIVAYNEQGKGAAQALGVGVNDLYGSVKAASRHESIRRDGFALGSEGLDLVAERIARAIEQAL